MQWRLTEDEWNNELKEQQREYNRRKSEMIQKEMGEVGQILSTDEQGKPKWIDVVMYDEAKDEPKT